MHLELMLPLVVYLVLVLHAVVLMNFTDWTTPLGVAMGALLLAGTVAAFVSLFRRIGIRRKAVGVVEKLECMDGVRVNAVAPGVITTPFHERFSTPQMLEGFKATIPMNRLGTAEECAGAFVYLASEQMSGYVTGQIIEVNGGQYMP